MWHSAYATVSNQHTVYTTISIAILCHYPECHYADGRILLIVILNVIMLNVIMLSVEAQGYVL
jgi:hypothetical protein